LLASLPPEQLATFLKRTSDRELEAIEHDWGWWGRCNQQAPKGDWRTWLLLAGRGFGKTRSGAECIRDQVIHHRRRRIALVAPTAADARDVMVEGESGLLAIGPPQQRPQYEPTKRRLTWPNGAIATTYSADEPERLRGPQHDAAWCDEIASWRYPEAWDMLMFGLRLGPDPRVVVTTTPKPVKIIRELLTDPTTVVTRGSSYENRANLADAFFAQIIRKYEGIRSRVATHDQRDDHCTEPTVDELQPDGQFGCGKAPQCASVERLSTSRGGSAIGYCPVASFLPAGRRLDWWIK